MTVYSKEKGFTRAPVGAGSVHRPNRAPRVSIPPNYRGHAIVEGRMGDGEVDSTAPVPRFEGLPRVSQLGEGRFPTYPRYGGVLDEAEPCLPEERPINEGEARGGVRSNEEFSTGEEGGRALPSGFLPSRHAFGGGLSLGNEELLLLGLILLLLREGGDCSDRGDLDETVILLGLLLLWG